MSKNVKVGPHGLTDIVYMATPDRRGKLNVGSTLSYTDHDRIVIVEDSFGHKIADAWFDGHRDQIELAEQWLLNMCIVKYGEET